MVTMGSGFNGHSAARTMLCGRARPGLEPWLPAIVLLPGASRRSPTQPTSPPPGRSPGGAGPAGALRVSGGGRVCTATVPRAAAFGGRLCAALRLVAVPSSCARRMAQQKVRQNSAPRTPALIPPRVLKRGSFAPLRRKRGVFVQHRGIKLARRAHKDELRNAHLHTSVRACACDVCGCVCMSVRVRERARERMCVDGWVARRVRVVRRLVCV
jgi:hypothetical protein